MADVSCVIKILCKHVVPGFFFQVYIHLVIASVNQSTYAGEFDGQNVGAGAVLQIQKSGGSRLLKT